MNERVWSTDGMVLTRG